MSQHQKHDPLNSIVVGAGLMGRWHATYLARAGGRLRAVVDLDPDAARKLCPTGARSETSLSRALDAFEPGIVHVCSPPGSHDELIAQALDKNWHVISEKPVTQSARAARELEKRAHARGRLLVPVHQFPFQKGFQQLKARLPRLGSVRRVEFSTATAGADGHADRKGVLLEIMPHAISLFRALGFPVEANAFDIVTFSNDELEFATRFADTALRAHIDLVSRPTHNELVVHTERGKLLADLYHGYLVTDEVASSSRSAKLLRPFRTTTNTLFAAGRNLLGRAISRIPAYPGLLELLTATYEAARSGGPAPIDGNEYVIAAELKDRLSQSREERTEGKG